jgi:hypothetical protein
MWIDVDTYRIHKIHILDAAGEAKPAEWTLILSEFDKPVTIRPPVSN